MTQVRQREAQRIFEAVVARYQMYPAYRDSGVEWLGAIPAHWDTVRLKLLCEINPGKFALSNAPADMEVSFLPMENIGENGELDLSEVRELGAVAKGYTHFHDDDVIIAKITPCFENGKGALVRGLVNGVGFGTTELYVLRVRNQVIPEFIYYLTRSTNFRLPGIAMMQGAAGQKRVRADFIADYPVSLPPIDEQRAIAAFLDRQTAKIDALIAKKRELIAALYEKRSAIISHAVTKGLHPDAPMKDSGIEWLGEIPAGWEVVRLKFLLARIDSGFSPDCIDMPAGEGEWGVLKTGCVNGGVFHPEENKTLPIDVDPLPQLEVNIGDVLMSRANGSLDLIGSVALVDKLPKARLLLSDKTFRFRFRQQNCEPEFFVKVMGSSLGREQIKLAVSGAGGLANNIAKSSIMEMRITLPPVCEQREIIEFLRLETSHIAYLIAKAEETIERLQEYRAAIISAAVTGKIDVRGA